MAEEFADRVVMLTGAAGGFGTLAARELAARGARLALSDLDGAAVAALADELGGGHFAAALDITDEAAVAGHIARAEDTLGPLDIAINNAGIGHTLTPLHETGAEVFDRVMAVNVRGTFLCLKHQIAAMRPRRAGVIVNVASAAGITGAGLLGTYAASKHAVVGLTRAAADETARHGLRVNALCPAFSPTPLFDAMADQIAARHGGDRQVGYDRATGRIPMGRVADPAEVIRAMLFLADPSNSYMTGAVLPVDGGLTAV